MINNLLIAVNAFAKGMLSSLSVDEILLLGLLINTWNRDNSLLFKTWARFYLHSGAITHHAW